MMKLSIVIPAYNAEKSISRTIDSLLAQRVDAMEIIVVDDGSHDQTGKICDDYAQQHECVKVIHQQNGGVSKARNTGIDVACGEWISFVDADDFCTPEMFSNLLKKNGDLIVGGFKNVIIENNRMTIVNVCKWPAKNYHSQEETIKTFFSKTFSNIGYVFYTHGKLFKKEILDKYQIRYDSTCNLGEDRLFVMNYLDHCLSSVFVEDTNYYIVGGNDNSLSSKRRTPQDLFQNFKLSEDHLIQFYNKYHIDEIKQYGDQFIISRLVDLILVPKAKDANLAQFIDQEVKPYLSSSGIRLKNITRLKHQLIGFFLLKTKAACTVRLCRIYNALRSWAHHILSKIKR